MLVDEIRKAISKTEMGATTPVQSSRFSAALAAQAHQTSYIITTHTTGSLKSFIYLYNCPYVTNLFI